MSSTAVTRENAALVVRAHELIAQWDQADRDEQARLDRHQEWVTHMVEVERWRPEALPCVHGTAMWPDRGQVCGACEADAEDWAESHEQTPAERMQAALAAARRELAAASRADSRVSAPGSDPWGIDDDLPPF